MKLWVADGEAGLMLGEGGAFRTIGPPGHALCAGRETVFCADGRRCFVYEARTGSVISDFPLPPGVCALEACGAAVYALSSEADSVTAFSLTGDPLISAPVGSYPRSLCKSPCGRYLAAACGAAGEIMLFDRALSCLARYRVPGEAVGVGFLPRGLAALCAVGDGELSARLLTISSRGVQTEILSRPDVPASLCVLPGGEMLMGCRGAVLRLRSDGRLAGRVPCAYPARIRPSPAGLLIIDHWDGWVGLAADRILYRGPSPEDAWITP